MIVLLIILLLAPSGLIVYGLLRPHKKYGIALYWLGTGLYSFGLAGAILDNHILSVPFGCLLFWLCHRLFLWLVKRKSRPFVTYARNFLTSIEDPHYPSCVDILLTKIEEIANNTPSENLSKDIPRATMLALFHISFDCLGSTNFRDAFTELNTHGMQLIHICQNCNDRLYTEGIISEETYADNIEAIRAQSNPLIHY